MARILLGNIHGRADAPHPALAGCAHAVSGHVAAVHIGSFLRRQIDAPERVRGMSAVPPIAPELLRR